MSPTRSRPRLVTPLGALAVALVAAGGLGLLAGFRPVVITTGSMAPAIPAGSLVVVKDRPPMAVAPGDVIVMDREDSLTITHRVVDVLSEAGGRAAVTRGDANDTDDPLPYSLDRPTPVVVQVVPGAGRVVSLARHPVAWVLLALVALGWLVRRRPAPSPSPPAADGDNRRARRPSEVVGVMALLGVSASALGSLALFTDSETVSEQSFTIGTLDISASPATAVVQMTGMVPGDSVTGPLRVTNRGSLDLRYSMSSATTEDVLAALLELTVKSGVADCDATGWGASGSVIFSGRLGSVAGDGVLGSPAPGADSGDRVLAPAADEVLCVTVALPLSVGNEAQGRSTSATFALEAEQTANNP